MGRNLTPSQTLTYELVYTDHEGTQETVGYTTAHSTAQALLFFKKKNPNKYRQVRDRLIARPVTKKKN